MKYPKFLKENSTIGVPAPSSGAKDLKKINHYHKALEVWQSFGYSCILSENLYSEDRGRSASSKDRASEINEMFLSDEIDGIVCASGGDFLVEILPYVDFQLLVQNPKFVIGFSDPTALLYPITSKYDIATILWRKFFIPWCR